jgi:hypothetical protein
MVNKVIDGKLCCLARACRHGYSRYSFEYRENLFFEEEYGRRISSPDRFVN